MKKYFLVVILAAGFGGNAQQIGSSPTILFQPQSFTVPDFSSVAKDYKHFYGEYAYTFDRMRTGVKSVYVQGDAFYYSGIQNLPEAQRMPQAFYLPGERLTDTGYAGLAVVAITALLNRDALFAKDYTPKDIDKSLFYPQPE